jgi:hypothetical protein
MRLGLKPQWLLTPGELGTGGGSNPRPAPASVRPHQKGVCLKKTMRWTNGILFHVLWNAVHKKSYSALVKALNFRISTQGYHV